MATGQGSTCGACGGKAQAEAQSHLPKAFLRALYFSWAGARQERQAPLPATDHSFSITLLLKQLNNKNRSSG